jgi:hypothetical protein
MNRNYWTKGLIEDSCIDLKESAKCLGVTELKRDELAGMSP